MKKWKISMLNNYFNYMMMLTKLFFFVALAFFAISGKAHAYLDPGTGSYFFQILAASFLGFLALFSAGKNIIIRFFSKKSKEIEEAKDDDNDGK